MNFAGSVDWAVDLNRTYANNGTGDLQEPGDDWPEYEPCPTFHYPYLEGIQTALDSGIIPKHCAAEKTLDTLLWMLDAAYNNYTDVNNGYDETFGYYVKYIESVVPAILENAFMWNMSITKDTEIVPEIGYGMNCTFLPCPNYTVSELIVCHRL